MTWLKWSWGFAKGVLGGLTSTAWLIMAGVAAFASWSILVWEAGASVERARCQAEALKSQIAKLELELKIQREADAAEDRLRAELEDENEQQKKVIDAYLEELKTRPDKCLLGPDAERLQ